MFFRVFHVEQFLAFGKELTTEDTDNTEESGQSEWKPFRASRRFRNTANLLFYSAVSCPPFIVSHEPRVVRGFATTNGHMV